MLNLMNFFIDFFDNLLGNNSLDWLVFIFVTFFVFAFVFYLFYLPIKFCKNWSNF